jgi:hypothetical protein
MLNFIAIQCPRFPASTHTLWAAICAAALWAIAGPYRIKKAERQRASCTIAF